MGGLTRRLDAVVVGAGPAGLAVTREIRRRSPECVVVEAGDSLGWSWRRHYESLVLHLFFVGHNYDASGGLYNIRRDAGLAADRVRARLRRLE